MTTFKSKHNLSISGLSQLNTRYVFVLVLIGVLSIGSYVVQEIAINGQKSAAAAINIAGRQRMLSQRIVLLRTHLTTLNDDAEKEILLRKLSQVINFMEESHKALLYGNDELGLKPATSKKLLSLYFGPKGYADQEIKLFINESRSDVELLKTEVLSPQYFNGTRRYDGSSILRLLNEITVEYQNDSDRSVAHFKRILQLATTIIIIALILSGLLIFRPMVSRLRRDVSEIAEAEERFRSITNSTVMAMIIAKGENQEIIAWNPAAEVTFGYSEEEILGQPLTVLVPERYIQDHTAGYDRVCKTGQHSLAGKTVELAALHKDGSEFAIELSLGSWLQGDERYFSSIIHDIQERKDLENRARRSQKMEAVGSLAGGIAHDFNNLLGIMSGNLTMLKRKADVDKKNLKRIDTSLKAAKRAERLTKQLLGFTRKSATSVETVCVNDVLRDMDALIEQSATRKVTISPHLDESLWLTNIDPGDLEDAIVNLCVNAGHAMPEGGTLTIETSNTTQIPNQHMQDSGASEYILLSISDTGMGIPKELREKIFEPFFTTKEKDKGTGLGLSMVFGFVRRSGGEIEVYSEEGIGTCFKIYLPKAGNITSSDHSTLLPKVIDNDTSGLHGTEKILIVDDEVHLADIAKDFLEDAGYKVYTANSADQALNMLRADNTFNLVLSDVIMPGGMNGFHLVIKTIQNWPHIRISLTSGYTSEAGKNLIQKNPIAKQLSNSILNKPYSQISLLKHVRANLDEPRLIELTEIPRTGIPEIDNDHQILVYLINQIHAIPTKLTLSETTVELLTNLYEYISQHFAREEAIMVALNVPNLVRHRNEHRNILILINDTFNSIKENTESHDWEEQILSLKDPLMLHMIEFDIDISKLGVISEGLVEKTLKSLPLNTSLT